MYQDLSEMLTSVPEEDGKIVVLLSMVSEKVSRIYDELIKNKNKGELAGAIRCMSAVVQSVTELYGA